MNDYDVIVVGVGTMGAATCYELASRGKRVLGLDQFDIPNTKASHHGFSRMFRLAYFEHPDYVTLLVRAFELWQKIECDSGEKLLHLTGGLYMGPADCELVSGSLAAAREHDLVHEILSHADMAKQYPQFHLPKEFVGFFEKRAGFVLPEHAITTYARMATQSGAVIRGNEPVTVIQNTGKGVTVRTPQGEYRAQTLVNCCGAWASKWLDGEDIPLTITRQLVAWVKPKRPELFELGTLPCWAIDQNIDGGYAGLNYGFPMMPDEPGLKLALHWPGRLTDPDDNNPELLEGDEDTFRPILQKLIPDADGPLVSHRVCLYANSADSHFIVDRHPKFANIIMACGFSGHGFKFASVMGQVLADLAIDGRTSLPIEFLSLARFKKN
jgi:sarcosine oxidase